MTRVTFTLNPFIFGDEGCPLPLTGGKLVQMLSTAVPMLAKSSFTPSNKKISAAALVSSMLVPISSATPSIADMEKAVAVPTKMVDFGSASPKPTGDRRVANESAAMTLARIATSQLPCPGFVQEAETPLPRVGGSTMRPRRSGVTHLQEATTVDRKYPLHGQKPRRP